MEYFHQPHRKMATPSSLLFSLSLFLLPFLSTAQLLNRNITLGSSLSTLDQNRSWVSPSGDFAFGFYPLPASNLFLIAVWFDKIPEKTVVWTARAGNENNPVQALPGSTIRLAEDGHLRVHNQLGQQIWSAVPRVQDVGSASMLDTGNFVLNSRDSAIFRWQSFDEPTDTILPTQILNKGSILSARLTQSNFSTGRFQLRMQGDGNLVLYTVALPTGFTYSPYWDTRTVDNGSELVFNSSGLLSLTLQANGTTGSLQLTKNTPTGPNFYHRATLDFDGVFRKYNYLKNGSNGDRDQSWTDVWSVPDNLCTAIRADFGSGACGFNSYCRLDTSKKPVCECPSGYSPLDPNNKFQGCKQDVVVPQECGADESNANKLFEMYDLQGIDWPLSDYERLDPMDEDECRRVCLIDCFCAASIFGGGSCWKKKLPLSNGLMDSSVYRKAFIKVAKANLSSLVPPPFPQNPRSKNKDGLIVAISVLLGSSAFVNIICVVALALLLFTSQKRVLKPQPGSVSLQSNLHLFSYKEIVQATNGFAEELGRGAFGSVYKGSLPLDSNTIVVAVKRLDKVMQEGLKEFQTELRTISKIHHRNLVPLLGFCDEGPHRMLVYEYMSNGSLASFLFSNPVRPSWDIRMQLAFGIARGLLYLHEECSSQIIHCDIKPENILLDKNLTARISDFGLAKLLKTDQSRTNTGIRGTRGYVAPEWFKRLAITTKVDVYSYGVMLLEIICCRKNVDMEIEEEESMVLTDWAYDCYNEGRLDMLVEGDEEAMSSVKALERLVKVAMWCIQEDPSLRPQMKKVSQMLEGTVEVAVPPNPSAFISSLG